MNLKKDVINNLRANEYLVLKLSKLLKISVELTKGLLIEDRLAEVNSFRKCETELAKYLKAVYLGKGNIDYDKVEGNVRWDLMQLKINSEE